MCEPQQSSDPANLYVPIDDWTTTGVLDDDNAFANLDFEGFELDNFTPLPDSFGVEAPPPPPEELGAEKAGLHGGHGRAKHPEIGAGVLEDTQHVNEFSPAVDLADAALAGSSSSREGGGKGYVPAVVPRTVRNDAFRGNTGQALEDEYDDEQHGPRLSKTISSQQSDRCWDSKDHDDAVYGLIKDGVDQLESGRCDCLVTAPLARRQRRWAHTLAKVKGLSHVSVGDTSFRRIIISKHTISGTRGRAWNTRSTYPRIVATALTIDNIVAGETKQSLQALVAAKALPEPSAFDCDIQGSSKFATAWAEFLRPEDAAEFHFGLHRHRPAGMDGVELEIGYQLQHHASPDTVSSPTAQGRRVPTSSLSGFSPPAPLACVLSKCRRSSLLTPSPQSHSSMGYSSGASINAGYSHDSDYGSGASATKKRKRHPVKKGGYPCENPDCEKVFDRFADLNKHRIVHVLYANRPHRCNVCGNGFHSSKDLRRHHEAKHTIRRSLLPMLTT
jgi:hypothetical protein